jgi:hypothetical protein
MSQDMTGWYYELPEGLTWERATEGRKRWDIDPTFAPLALAPGVVAWGRLLPSNYKRVA